MKTREVTRRDLLQRGGIAAMGAGALTLAGIGGYAWPHEAATAASVPTGPATPDDARGVLHFVGRPDLTPPALTIAHYGRTSSASASDPPYFILARPVIPAPVPVYPD